MTASDRESNEFPRLLTDNLWVVGNYYFNLYLVKGEQAAALIEVGVSAVVDDVVRQLGDLKIRPSFMVVTHPHADHITGLPGLRERFPNDLVVAGEGAAEFLAHPKTAPALFIEDRHMSDFLAARESIFVKQPTETCGECRDFAFLGALLRLYGRLLHLCPRRSSKSTVNVLKLPNLNLIR